MRAFQRTKNHDRTTDQSFFIDKSFNPPPLLLVLDHASLNQQNRVNIIEFKAQLAFFH